MAADKSAPGNTSPNDDVIAVSDEALLKAESFVEAEEGVANRLMGWAGRISTAIAVVMSLFHLYAAYAIVPTQELRYTHVAFTLVLSFLLFPLATRFRNRVRWWDVVPGIFAVATIFYALWGGDDFTDRATLPDRWDVIVGVIFIVLLPEATRRTTGAIMPVVSLLFIAYAMFGPLGGAVANVLSKSLPNVQATAEVTGGSVDNLKLIASGQSEMAFTMADAALDALQGQDKFKSGKVPLQALLVVYPNRMHVVTVEGSGIETMADLKGKRVSTGSPGGATEVMAFRVIEAAGLDKDKDMKRERLGVAESVNAIKDRKIDAFFWVGGIPTAAVTDLAATPGMKMKLIDHSETVEKMNAKYGKLYTASKIKAGAYQGTDKDNAIAEVWNLIVTGDKMSSDDAYAIVKTLVEKKADIVAVHKEAESFSLDNQVQERSPIPFHPGALKYFKEKGLGG